MRRGWRALWPRRMVSQLLWLLALSLLLANLMAIVGIQYAGSLVHPMSRSLALERLAIAFQATQHLQPPDAAPLLASMRDGGARFWVDSQPEVPRFPMRREERRLAAELAERLGLPNVSGVTMQLERADGGRARGVLFSPARWQPLRLRTSLLLADGRSLNGVQPMIQAYEWWRLLSYSLPVASVPLLLISLFFLLRVVRPVRTLARATDQISRGEWMAPLPLAGPQEARELTQAFNLMQERLARHIEGRTQMLAAMSHDLNTPLTGLRLQLELLEPGPERDDMLESLNDLRLMVSETLNFIRGEASQEQSQRCDIGALLGDLARRYQLQGKAVAWPGGEGVAIACRPVALRRALGNLIDNALAYGGDATLSLRRVTEGVCIEILDHGPGIAPENLTRVLEPFVRLHDAPPPTQPEAGGGLGLGLAIARACIHAHGGELTLQNRPPAGLCAVILLPLGIRS